MAILNMYKPNHSVYDHCCSVSQHDSVSIIKNHLLCEGNPFSVSCVYQSRTVYLVNPYAIPSPIRMGR